jgi:TRAP-type C4-dicarboxylate transport system permease small subunit
MLAEDIGGWLVAGGLLFGGVGASLLALGALVPASRGNRSLTVLLVAPAIIVVLLTTCWLGYGYAQTESSVHEEVMDNFVKPWFLMASLPLATSVVASMVLWFKKRPRT